MNNNIFILSEKISFLVTAVLWAGLVVTAVYLPVKSGHKKYNEIQITLSDQVQNKKPEVLEEQKTLSQTEKPLQKKETKTEAQPAKMAAVPETKTPTQKTAAKPAQSPVKKAQVREEKLFQSVEDLMKAQNAAPKKAAVWDDSLFDDNNTVTSNTASGNFTPQAQKIENALSGTAGKINEVQTQTGAHASEIVKTPVQKNAGNIQESTGKILSTLENIAESKTLAKETGTGTSTGSNNNVIVTDSGSQMLNVSDGRTLVKPLKPSITISSEKQKSLQNITVKFRFTVNANGTVNYNSIYCSSGAINSEVEKEIREQIARWIFQSGVNPSEAFFDLIISAVN